MTPGGRDHYHDDLPAVASAGAMSVDDLLQRAERSDPVVVSGAFEGWPALHAGRRSPDELNAYLVSLGSGIIAPVMETPPAGAGRFGYSNDLREFSFTKRQRPLEETLNRILRLLEERAPPTVAIQMLALDVALPRFGIENPMPLAPAGASPRLWLGGSVRTQIHNDRDHNLACVIAGRRRFLLFPPDQVANLYIGPMDNPPPLSLVDPDEPDLERFPRFREALAAARVAYLEPGEALLIPRYWWHHVASLDRYNAMVNYWWGENPPGIENPRDVFLAALLALGAFPPPERQYWKAMFAAYVFGDGEAVAHIPERLRGPLGEMRPFERSALKRRLLESFLRSSS